MYEAELNDKQEVVDWVLKEGGEGLEEVVSGETADAAEEDNADADTAIDEDGGRTDENSNKLEHDLKDMHIQDNATSH